MTKTHSFPLRFSSKQQKNDAKRLAKKSNQSLNGYLLSFIESQREVNKEVLSTKK